MNNKLSVTSIIMTVIWLAFLVIGIITQKPVIVLICLAVIAIGVFAGINKTKKLNSANTLWNEFIIQNPKYKDKNYEIWRFAEDDDFHKDFFPRIFKSEVTGESYLVDNFVKSDVPLPKVGNVNIVCDALGQAFCVVETVEVIETSFNDVTSRMAQIEGAATLSEWKEYNKRKYAIIADSIDEKFTGSSKIVFDKFEIIYKGKEIEKILKYYDRKMNKKNKAR